MNNKLLIGRAAKYSEPDNAIWFVGKNVSLLFKIDLSKYEVTQMIKIPCLNNISGFDYIDIIDEKDEIYIVSYDAQTIVFYDKAVEKIEEWSVPLVFKGNDSRRIYKAAKCDDKIYLIGCLDYKDIIVYDIAKKDAEEIKNIDECNVFSYCCMLEDSILLIPFYEKNKIMKIDINDSKQDIIQIEGIDDGYVDCIALDDGYVFASHNGKIVKCDKHFRLVWEKHIGTDIYCIKAIPNNKVAVWGLFKNSIWIVSDEGNLLKMDMEYTDSPNRREDKFSKFEMVVPIEDKVMFQSRMTGKFYILDDEKIIDMNIVISEQISEEIYKYLKAPNNKYLEGEVIGCEEFLQRLI